VFCLRQPFCLLSYSGTWRARAAPLFVFSACRAFLRGIFCFAAFSDFFREIA
jgi:hypothetical protein